LLITAGVAVVVLFIATRNLTVLLAALFSIVGAVTSTVGTVCLFGWELNFLEFIIISLSVGLSIDYAIHLGVAFKCTDKEGDGKARIRETLMRVGGAVTMASLTTFLAGASIAPAQTDSFHRMGAFMMLVMVYAWIYSILFFAPIVAILEDLGKTVKKRRNMLKVKTIVECSAQDDSGGGDGGGEGGGGASAAAATMEENANNDVLLGSAVSIDVKSPDDDLQSLTSVVPNQPSTIANEDSPSRTNEDSPSSANQDPPSKTNQVAPKKSANLLHPDDAKRTRAEVHPGPETKNAELHPVQEETEDA